MFSRASAPPAQTFTRDEVLDALAASPEHPAIAAIPYLASMSDAEVLALFDEVGRRPVDRRRTGPYKWAPALTGSPAGRALFVAICRPAYAATKPEEMRRLDPLVARVGPLGEFDPVGALGAPNAQALYNAAAKVRAEVPYQDMPRRDPWTPDAETLATLLASLAARIPYKQVASDLGVPVAALREYITEHKIAPRRPVGRPSNTERDDAIRREFAQGAGREALAEKYGLGPQRIYQIVGRPPKGSHKSASTTTDRRATLRAWTHDAPDAVRAAAEVVIDWLGEN